MWESKLFKTCSRLLIAKKINLSKSEKSVAIQQGISPQIALIFTDKKEKPKGCSKVHFGFKKLSDSYFFDRHKLWVFIRFLSLIHLLWLVF